MKQLRLIFTITITLFFYCSKEKQSEIAANKMKEFIINISNYARKFNPEFIIIPQNGIELAFRKLDPE